MFESIHGKPTDHRLTCTEPRPFPSHQKSGFYYDRRLATLRHAVEHYDGFSNWGLTDQEKRDLGGYLKSL